MYIILGILIFGILIATHELGHFTVAKLCNVRVSEFAIGMGPAIIKKQKGETLYAWRAVPLGGYCAMDEDAGESDDPRAFVNQVWWKRMLILIAGAAMNFLFGFLVLLFLVPKSAAFATPTLTGFYDDCPYYGEQALLEGDTFYSIDGHRTYFTSNVSYFLSRSESRVYDIVLLRGDEKIELEDFSMPAVEYTENGETETKIGIYFGEKETGAAATLSYAWDAAKDFTRLVWLGLSDLVSGAVGLKELSGPVGIVEIINDVGESAGTVSVALSSIFYLSAFIAINLAVMNMLPIPALDGGRVLFLLITAAYEGLSRKKLDPKYEGYVHTAGFVLLLGLMAVVMFNDIYKLFV